MTYLKPHILMEPRGQHRFNKMQVNLFC